MKTRERFVLFLVALFLVAGCFEVDQEYTINPDGSGKVVHRLKQPDLLGQGEAALAEVVKQQMTEAKGVDAWSDVSAKIDDDGSVIFSGTAYFSDFNQLEFKNGGGLEFNLSRGADGSLTLASKEPAKAEVSGSSSEPALSEEEIQEAIKKARAQWNQTKGMAQAFLSGLKWSATYHLPATIRTSAGFEKTDPQTVRVEMKGEQFVDAFEKVFQDEALLRKLAEAKSLEGMEGNDSDMPPEVTELLMGGERPKVVTAAKAKSQFDYAAEVASAKAGVDEMMASLPAAARPKPAMPPPAKGGDFRSLKVAAVSYVFDEKHVWSPEGGRLTLIGELPGSVVSVGEGMLKSAVANTGTDLMPEEYRREISGASLDDDKTTVKFDVNTALPDAAVKGFREIAGVLTYVVAEGEPVDVDLGFDELEAGAKGKKYDAVIGEMGESEYSQGNEQIEVQLTAARDAIVDIEFRDATGKPIEVDSQGTSWTNDVTTFSFSREGSFPRDGRVVVKMRENLKRYEIPFSVKNVDLFGRPMK